MTTLTHAHLEAFEKKLASVVARPSARSVFQDKLMKKFHEELSKGKTSDEAFDSAESTFSSNMRNAEENDYRQESSLRLAILEARTQIAVSYSLSLCGFE